MYFLQRSLWTTSCLKKYTGVTCGPLQWKCSFTPCRHICSRKCSDPRSLGFTHSWLSSFVQPCTLWFSVLFAQRVGVTPVFGLHTTVTSQRKETTSIAMINTTLWFTNRSIREELHTYLECTHVFYTQRTKVRNMFKATFQSFTSGSHLQSCGLVLTLGVIQYS